MKNIVRILIALVALIPAAVAIAQTTHEMKVEGDVVAVYDGKLVVKMSTGEVREFTPPADRKFEVDGQMLSLAELKPGTHLSATVTTTTTPEVVRTVVLKNAEVVKVSGSNLTVKQDGQFKSYNVPAGFTFLINGENVPVSKLQEGSKLSAEIVYKSEKTLTEQEVKVAGATPVVAPVETPSAAAAPVAEMAPAPEMPKTASNLALIGLLGLALVAAGAAFRR
ncbi:MAG: hypothetical protein WC538_15655 [Thermoanaerobaculia bacterium]|jgi:hypothetical protein